MPEPQSEPRILRWLGELEQAGDDADRARAVLHRVRDSGAGKLEKEDFYRALAQQAVMWLQEAARGKPFSDAEREQMAQAAHKRFETKLKRAIETVQKREGTGEAKAKPGAPPAEGGAAKPAGKKKVGKKKKPTKKK